MRSYVQVFQDGRITYVQRLWPDWVADLEDEAKWWEYLLLSGFNALQDAGVDVTRGHWQGWTGEPLG